MADGIVLRRADIVPPRPLPATAMQVAQRADNRELSTGYAPMPSGAFTHATTNIESTIGATTDFPAFSTTSASSDLAAALANLESQVVHNRLLLNRVVYTLEANGFTS